ncbi:hypothetical protein EUX98_g1721 [Antrodiella citrinella]|uniref:chitinase n=1 Tax=Antrodiella citrinella TaxID=2447956 RepID=A0A4S4N3S9_9APHY|nr:hypothetical protein EUX98_g1721 [Antrodiella citrinella]
MFAFKNLLASLVLLLSVALQNVHSAPADGLDHQARSILARATPAAPHFALYSDKGTSGITGPPPPSDIQGWNVFILSFLLLEGAWDKAEEWVQLSASQRSSLKSQYAAAGIKLIVSAFGSTDVPTSSGADPVATANTMAAWVQEFDLDGIDVDYEDFNAMDAGDGKAEQWLITFTQQLRTQLPVGQYILTHAPVAPWFEPNRWGGGGYLRVDQTVGNLIDWYNVQFYNQNDYTTCTSLLTTSGSGFPQTSLFQIIASGISESKLVIGKPANSGDATNGYIDPGTLAGCVSQAVNMGWNGGVMSWEFPDAAASWIQTVRGSAFPE